jgi:hypothetical protein
MQSVVNYPLMLSVFMLNVTKLNVIVLSVVMLSVMAPKRITNSYTRPAYLKY